jgi:hypothetical protein
MMGEQRAFSPLRTKILLRCARLSLQEAILIT